MACLAYSWWGLSALFWRELASVAAIDQLSFRVATGAFYLVVVWLFRRYNPLSHLTAAHWRYGLIAATAIGANWVVFLWAISTDQAVEASLGYFLMPLFAVALGVGLLGERLRPLQSGALVLASIGIIWTFIAVGSVPWIALVLGATFAIYGWARKQGPWQAVEGLTFETLLLAPIVLVILGTRSIGGANVVGDASNGSLWVAFLLAATGVATVVPLLLFASAAKKVSLTVIGFLQYINPTLQFLVGWRIFGEDVSTGRLSGFAWIWVALALIVLDELRSKRPVDRGAARGDQGVVGRGEGLAPEEPAVR